MERTCRLRGPIILSVAALTTSGHAVENPISDRGEKGLYLTCHSIDGWRREEYVCG